MSSKTEVLLHFDESAIKDECGNVWNYCNTPNPNENISTFSKFGKSLAYPCTISRQLEPTSCIYTQWFTVDFWVYLADNNTYYPLQILRGSMYKLECYISGAELDVAISSYSNGDISYYTKRGTIPLKKWCHVAIVRDNTTFYFFINGICTSTITNESRLIQYSSNDSIRIGDINSNMDEFRISTYPEWTTNFTPPTSSYDRVVERNILMTDSVDNYYGLLK